MHVCTCIPESRIEVSVVFPSCVPSGDDVDADDEIDADDDDGDCAQFHTLVDAYTCCHKLYTPCGENS